MPDDELHAAGLPGGDDRIERAEIVVGVPSFNCARTIGRVVEAVVAGLTRDFGGASCAVVNADAGSHDATPELARQAAGGALPVVAVRSRPPVAGALAPTRPGLAGDAGALRAVLAEAGRLGARACALVDGDVGDITPEWIGGLLRPVLDDGIDLVAPLYARHRYEGLLTGGLLYPLTRALYGVRVRQPVGGHFGLSGRLAAQLLRAGIWERGGTPGSLDLWMVTSAAADGRRIGQAPLGPLRRGGRRAAVELGASFAAAVGTAFGLMEEYRPVWWSVVATSEVPTYGPPVTLGVDPVSVNLDRMVSTFRQGLADLMPDWRRALGIETCEALAALGNDGAARFRFPPDLWARAVYDGAVAYHQRRLPRRHLLRAMIPLYLGRCAAFVLDTEAHDAAGVEADIEGVCGAFEAMKPHLLDRWDDPRS